MKRMKWTGAGVALALALAAPSAVAAQQSNAGWWSWALGDALGVTGRSPGSVVLDPRQRGGREKGDRDDEEGRSARGGTSIGDIILGRSGSRQGKVRGRRTDGYGRGESGRGPAFCRNGVGHPTKGRQWCVDKGFGLGRGGLLNGRWREDRTWGDVILGRSGTRTRRGGVLGQGGLTDVLGRVIMGRLQTTQRRLGARSPLQGRWIREGDRSLVLQVRSGRRPIAELTDLNGDGRADVVLLARR